MCDVRALMRKIIGPHSLTIRSVMTDAEATINGRPLLPLNSTSSDGPDAQTPNHFLVGKPLLAFPTQTDSDTKITNPKRWDLVERLSHDVWKQWHSRYLQSLQSRSKWTTPSRNFELRDITLQGRDLIKG